MTGHSYPIQLNLRDRPVLVVGAGRVATRKIERDGLASLEGLKMGADALKVDVLGDVGIATFILKDANSS